MTETTANVAATISDAYSRAKETYTADDAHEITADVYTYALCVLPPIYGDATATQVGRFWVGEPYTHRRGREVSLECWEGRGQGHSHYVGNGKFFCRLSVVEPRKAV